MNRRDFFLFRAGTEARMALSCQKLYMRYLDAALPEAAAGEVPSGYGEPLRAVARTSPDELFHKLDEELRGVDVVQLFDTAWLASAGAGFRQHLEAVLDDFRARGGRIV
jgi:hypothetical protein